MHTDDPCPDCDGDGASDCTYNWTDEGVDVKEVIRHHDEEHAGQCPSCGGHGDFRMHPLQVPEPCPSCGGSGSRPADHVLTITADTRAFRAALSPRPTVTDAEVKAVRRAIADTSDLRPFDDVIRTALEAAARVLQETDDE